MSEAAPMTIESRRNEETCRTWSLFWLRPQESRPQQRCTPAGRDRGDVPWLRSRRIAADGFAPDPDVGCPKQTAQV